MIAVENLSVSYGNDRLALEQVSLTIEGPAVIGIIGPNGAGKSTFMKALLNLIPHEGTVRLNGKTQNLAGHVAYVEQKSQIDYHFPITVRECVSLGIYRQAGLFRCLTPKNWDKVDEVLAQVGLTDFKNQSINALSGGQFQRMLLARCLTQEAEFIFLDEPFTGIDSVSEKMIADLLKSLKNQEKTILVVHHDLSKIRHYFDRLLILNKKQIAYGSVDDIFTPDYLKKAYGDSVFAGGV